ncbi:MAG TPA: PilZ domain-containing protein [Nitrospiria bacterium]|nr:PilZ domain-containing protein [Nitrospiria bacterium]
MEKSFQTTRFERQGLSVKNGGRSKQADSKGPDIKAFIERRVALRLPICVLEVKWKKFNQVFIAKSQNISMGGLFISTDRSLRIGDQFPVEFVLPDQKTKITCTGEVTWTRMKSSPDATEEGVGVRFLDINGKTKKAIGEWIKKQEAQAKKRA